METLKRTWNITNRCTKWWGIFLVVLLLIAFVSIFAGVLNIDADLDLVVVNDVTNPYFVLSFFLMLLLVLFYVLFFLVSLPIVFLLSLIKNKRKPAELV